MKKRYLALLSCAGLVALASCGDSNSLQAGYLESAYEQGSSLAEEKNYSVSLSARPEDYSSYNFLGKSGSTYPSTLAITYVDAKYSLVTYDGTTIAADLSSTNVNSTSGFNSVGRVYLNANSPTATYTTYDSASLKYTLHFINLDGTELFTETADSNSYFNLTSASKFTNDEDADYPTYYQYINVVTYSNTTSLSVSSTHYIKYTSNASKYIVSEITMAEYMTAQSKQKEEMKSLYELGYNCDGYGISLPNGDLALYDEDKEYITTLPLDSFDDYEEIDGEDHIWFIKSERYYDSLVNQASYATYRTYGFDVNLSNGKITELKDLDFYVSSVKSIWDEKDEYVTSTLVEFYELEKDGELGKIERVALIKDSLDFSDSYYYDNMYNYSKVYKLADDSYLVNVSGSYYYVEDDEIKENTNISSISSVSANNILYKGLDGLYHYTDLSSLENDTSVGYDYETFDTYNGSRVCATKNGSNYTLSDGKTIPSSSYNYLVNYKLVVTDTSITAYGASDLITLDSDYVVTSISTVSTLTKEDTLLNITVMDKTTSRTNNLYAVLSQK